MTINIRKYSSKSSCKELKEKKNSLFLFKAIYFYSISN